jgi:hypothetical protein
MKKLITAISATLLTTVALAQSTSFKIEKTLVCDDTKKIVNELMNGDYKEMPVWGGSEEKTKFMLLVNKESGTWTLIQFTPGVGCVLGVGDESKVLNLDKKKLNL